MGEYGVKEQNQLASTIAKDSIQRAACAGFTDNRPQTVIQAQLIQAMQEGGVRINSTGFDNRNKYRTLPARRIISEIPRNTMQATFDYETKVKVTTDLIMKTFQNICQQRFGVKSIDRTLLPQYYPAGINGICQVVLKYVPITGGLLSKWEIADIIVNIPEIALMIKERNIEDRKTPEGPSTPLEERLKNIAYRHYTTAPDSIFANGLDPNYDQGNGIAQNGTANAGLTGSFTKTSKGWAFVTRSGQDSRYSIGRQAVDVFILPEVFNDNIKIDVDSHGYKSNQKLDLIGYNSKLNPTAIEGLSAFFKVDPVSIQAAYSKMRPPKPLPLSLSSSSQSSTEKQASPEAEIIPELEIQTKKLETEVKVKSRKQTKAKSTPKQRRDLQEAQVLAAQKTGEEGALNKTLLVLKAHPYLMTAAIGSILAFILYLLIMKRSK